MNCSIPVFNICLLAKLPRRISFRTRMENQISIWLSHDACLGVKWKTMRWSLWRRNASRVAFDAGLTFDAEVAIEAAMLRNKANDGLGEMDVEVVANDIPPCVGGGAAQQGVEKTSKVLLGPGVADHPGDFADRDIETGDQGLRAVAAILEFAPLDLARLHRQPRRDALQRLNARHLVDRDCAMALVGAGCRLVNLTDIGAFGVKGRIWFWRQPVTKAVRFKVGLFFKKRPTERCEMFETRPRRIASSAISRWLQWLIGRSLSDGFSQVIAITAQICSGVYVAGAPERGASASRSDTDWAAGACRHRANTAPSSATRRVLARSRGRQYCRRHAKSYEPATPTVVRSNGLAPALPALHGAQAKQSPDRRPARASQLPLSASDSSCHGAADSTPVLLPESSLAHTTLVPPRKAESQLPLGGTRFGARKLAHYVEREI